MQIELTEEELERVIDALEVAAHYAERNGHNSPVNDVLEKLRAESERREG